MSRNSITDFWGAPIWERELPRHPHYPRRTIVSSLRTYPASPTPLLPLHHGPQRSVDSVSVSSSAPTLVNESSAASTPESLRRSRNWGSSHRGTRSPRGLEDIEQSKTKTPTSPFGFATKMAILDSLCALLSLLLFLAGFIGFLFAVASRYSETPLEGFQAEFVRMYCASAPVVLVFWMVFGLSMLGRRNDQVMAMPGGFMLLLMVGLVVIPALGAGLSDVMTS